MVLATERYRGLVPNSGLQELQLTVKGRLTPSGIPNRADCFDSRTRKMQLHWDWPVFPRLIVREAMCDHFPQKGFRICGGTGGNWPGVRPLLPAKWASRRGLGDLSR